MNRPVPPGANNLSQSLRVVVIGLVDLHLESGARMPGVETNDFEPEIAKLVHEPWRHRSGLDLNAGVISRMPPTKTLICSETVGHCPRQRLRPVLSMTQIAVIFCETSNPTKLVIDEPPMVRITGQLCPDRGTIGGSSANRDYRMSVHDE
jgi:hypothetical protein